MSDLKERLADMSALSQSRTPADALKYIEELEAKVLECGVDIEAVQLWGSENENEIAELQAKLAKAVDQTLDAASAYLKQQYGLGALSHPVDRGRIIAELKGEKR